MLFAISAKGGMEFMDPSLIGQPFMRVEQLANCPIGSTSLILAARCSDCMACLVIPKRIAFLPIQAYILMSTWFCQTGAEMVSEGEGRDEYSNWMASARDADLGLIIASFRVFH